MHLTESDNFLPKILDRAADEVDGVVYYQKPVMHDRAISHFYSGILGVVAPQIIGDLGMARVGIDCCQHPFLAFCQHFQYSVVHIVVYEDNPFCGFSD